MMSQHRDTLDGMQLAFAGLDGSVQLRRQKPTNSRYQFARQTIMDIYKLVYYFLLAIWLFLTAVP